MHVTPDATSYLGSERERRQRLVEQAHRHVATRAAGRVRSARRRPARGYMRGRAPSPRSSCASP